MRDERFHDGALTLHCAHCDRWLPPDAFPANRHMLRGRGSWCRACQVARTREWRATNADAINARRRLAYVSVKGR